MVKHSEEFKQDAVRIAVTSGQPRERAVADLGIGRRKYMPGRASNLTVQR